MHTLINEQALLSAMPQNPKILMLVDGRGGDALLVTRLRSLVAQTWSHWEAKVYGAHASFQDDRLRYHDRPLTLATLADAVSGTDCDWVGLLPSDVIPHPQALGLFARAILRNPTIEMLFSAEQIFNGSADRSLGFFCKPSFCRRTLAGSNYLTGVCAFSLAALKVAIDAIAAGAEQAAIDRDLAYILATHLAKRPSFQAELLDYHCSARVATTLRGAAPSLSSASENQPQEHQAPENQLQDPQVEGSVLVIIPFKDQCDLTIRCLRALELQRSPLDLTVVLVNNNSMASIEPVQNWLGLSRKWSYTLETDDGCFDYARINNDAFKRHGNDHSAVLFLNNDVEIESQDCVDRLTRFLAAEPACAFAGIRLCYPRSNVIQHGGIFVREVRAANGLPMIGHLCDELDFVTVDHRAMGVTFACAMTRPATFAKLGMLERNYLPNGFGDLDICLTAIEQGMFNFYFGSLHGIHHESASRSSRCEDIEFAELYRRHGGTLFRQMNERLALVKETDQRANQTDLPLRYRIADQVNDKIKIVSRPLQSSFKRWLDR